MELAAKVGDYLVRAEALEAKAQKYRERARALGDQLAAMASGEARPRTVRAAGVRPKRGGASDFIRQWAFDKGADFALSEVRTALKAKGATLGAFYHLVKRGEIEMIRHGRYISAEFRRSQDAEDNDHPKIVNLR